MDEFEDDEVEDNFDPNDTEEDIEDDFDPNDTEDDIEDDFDPNDTEDDIEDDFDPNDTEEDIEDDFDPNNTEDDIEDDFDPNDTEDDIEDDFDPNDTEEKNEENEFEQIDNGEGIGAERNNFDKEKGEEEQSEEGYHENISSESTCTVLVSENKEEMQEADQDELEREIEKELEEGVEGINKYLEEEAEFINAYQEMVGKERELDQERELEGDERQKTDEEWEKEVESAAYTAEQLYESTKEIETNAINEEISEIKDDLEIEKEVEQSEEISEPQLSNSREEVWEQEQELEQNYEEREELEQHQVEATIEEELEIIPEPIINEKEVEKLQELDIEEQFQRVHFNEYIDELVEKQEEDKNNENDKIEQVEKEELEAQTSKIKEANFELYEEVEVERDELEQHQVEATIEEELETIPEPIINEKEVENLQELELGKQFQTVHFKEYIDELVEKQDEDKNNENDEIKQEQENIEQTQEVKHQSTYLQEKLEEQEQELELDYEEKDEVEQHQVEAAIEEELKTEAKPIVNEEELEYIKVLEPEKQLEAEVFYEFIEELAHKQNEEKEEREENEEKEEISTEQKVAQIMRELDIPQKINSGETEVEPNRQEGGLEHEITSPDEKVVKQLEIEENKDHQQELEEILEQVRKIEQEALNEIEQEEEDSDKTIEKNYERVKMLYKQQTGKRPIYANKETKGFKQWLEQKKKPEEKEKTKQKKELKEEQKKEETWKWFLKNWIEKATEIDSELKSELKKLVEEYDELEKLIKKYSQLYNKAQRELLSQAEKNELKSLIKALQKIDPIKIELFLGVREIKRYLDGQHFFDFWDKPRVNRIRHHFFTQLSQIYKSLKQDQKKKENLEEILRNWIEQASEEEISPELKALLKEIVENYSELEELATKFMELFKKEQLEQISQSEKVKLKSLIKTLEKLDPINIVLFANIRAIKHYLNDQNLDDLSNKARVNRVISKFFKHISQKYKKLRKTQENKENSEEIIRNWIEQVSEGEISPEVKVKLKEIVKNKENLEALKPELDAIESESEDKKDFLEESTKIGSEESDDQETELLQELNRQEMGKSPIYYRKKTKSYCQWLEQRELIKNSKSESEKIKEIKEKDWKTTLKQWIRDASEEECNAELKSELKKALESYNEFEDLTRKFLELYKKSQYEKLSEKEKNRIKSFTEKLQEPDPIQLELLVNIRAFKDYFNNQYWNKLLANRVRSKFFKRVSQKYKEIRKEQQFYSEKIENLQESIKKLPITMNNYYKLKCSRKYSNNNFKTIVFSYYKLYSLQINSSNLIKKLGFKLEESCEDFFFYYFNQILQNFREKNIYKNLPISKRSPHLIAAAIIYIILETYFDVVFTKKEYSSILSLNYEKFTDCVNYCIENYFIIDDSVYYNKILHYYHILIEKLNKDYKLNLSEEVRQTAIKEKVTEYYFSLKNNFIYIPEDILLKLYVSQQKIYAILNNHGLDINILFKKLKYKNFMPQYMALALIYFCKDFEPIKSKKKLNYIELGKLTNYSSRRIQDLVTLFRFNIENMENHRYYHTKYYSKEHFINDLEGLYKETERLDYLFLLKAFKILRLTPNEFSQNVVSYVNKKGECCSPRTLVQILKKKVSSIGSKTYYKMEKNVKILYHQKKISSVQLQKVLRLIRRAENIKSSILFHNSVKYSFKFNRINLKKIRDPIIKLHLKNHFLKINENTYPKQVFDDKSVTRGSLFYLRGTNKEKLLPDKIIKLIQQLNIGQKMGIQKTGFLRSFSEYANESYTSYLDQFGIIPYHQPILNSLITKKNIIAIEMPVWGTTRNGEYFSGHIDVLAFYNDMIIIGDYKPTEKEIFRSLPQICTYAYLIKQQLQLKNFKKIVCIGFSKDVVWAFKPQILEDIYKFVKNENTKRTENLKCKGRSSVVKDLAQEIGKILSI